MRLTSTGSFVPFVGEKDIACHEKETDIQFILDKSLNNSAIEIKPFFHNFSLIVDVCRNFQANEIAFHSLQFER